MNKGYVYLVGAGPGDADLITLKGLKTIQKADVIVYDRLATPKLLTYRKSGSEIIYVGKKSNQHTMKQEDINKLLVDLAKEGKIITRLKGGDPYVFGRGGEEGELLKENNIPFEVVPGITSAIAAPNYAGIPVTHRNMAVNFTVITGHEDPTKDLSQINWQRLAEDSGTLIFLMGVGNLENIVSNLIKNGKNDITPTALIQWGTRMEQRVVTGNLKNIVQIVRENNIGSPAIILVGEVVTLRDTLNWFENKPLFSKRIVVTRAREQASKLVDFIEDLGAEAWQFPTIKINNNFEKIDLIEELKSIERYNWLVFSSANAFKSFKEELIRNKIDIRRLANIKICAIGSETKKEIEDSGLIVDIIPEKFIAESVEEALKPHICKNDLVLIPRSNLGRQILVDTIERLGAIVKEVIAYETIIDRDNDIDLLSSMLEEDKIHLITFTSSSTVKNFMQLLGGNAYKLLSNVDIASIGPITTNTLKEYNLTPSIEAKVHTIPGLVESIKEYYMK